VLITLACLLLQSAAGVLFSASLELGMREGARTPKELRAINRLDYLVPFALLFVGAVAAAIRSRMSVSGSGAPIRRLERALLFLCFFLPLLVVAYFGGVFLFEDWGRGLVKLLER
jgi:hypothetical protein